MKTEKSESTETGDATPVKVEAVPQVKACCPDCKGKGFDVKDTFCKTCGGKGSTLLAVSETVTCAKCEEGFMDDGTHCMKCCATGRIAKK